MPITFKKGKKKISEEDATSLLGLSVRTFKFDANSNIISSGTTKTTYSTNGNMKITVMQSSKYNCTVLAEVMSADKQRYVNQMYSFYDTPIQPALTHIAKSGFESWLHLSKSGKWFVYVRLPDIDQLGTLFYFSMKKFKFMDYKTPFHNMDGDEIKIPMAAIPIRKADCTDTDLVPVFAHSVGLEDRFVKAILVTLRAALRYRGEDEDVKVTERDLRWDDEFHENGKEVKMRKRLWLLIDNMTTFQSTIEWMITHHNAVGNIDYITFRPENEINSFTAKFRLTW